MKTKILRDQKVGMDILIWDSTLWTLKLKMQFKSITLMTLFAELLYLPWSSEQQIRRPKRAQTRHTHAASDHIYVTRSQYQLPWSDHLKCANYALHYAQFSNASPM